MEEENVKLLKELIKPFGPHRVFIPETARIFLATSAFSFIKHENRAIPRPETSSSPGTSSAASTYRSTSLEDVLTMIIPNALNINTHLAGYEKCIRSEEVMQAFFAPGIRGSIGLDNDAERSSSSQPPPDRAPARPLAEASMSVSLYEGLGTVFMPLLVETRQKEDTWPDLSKVVAISKASVNYDMLPPVIFIQEEFTHGLRGGRAGARDGELTPEQMAPVREWVKAAYLGCSIFQRWCRSNGVAVDCKFVHEHPCFDGVLD